MLSTTGNQVEEGWRLWGGSTNNLMHYKTINHCFFLPSLSLGLDPGATLLFGICVDRPNFAYVAWTLGAVFSTLHMLHAFPHNSAGTRWYLVVTASTEVQKIHLSLLSVHIWNQDPVSVDSFPSQQVRFVGTLRLFHPVNKTIGSAFFLWQTTAQPSTGRVTPRA